MTLRLLFATALIAVASVSLGWAREDAPPLADSPSLPAKTRLAPYQERLAKAKSVHVQVDILGVGVDSSLESAHTTFDPLSDPAHRPTEKANEAESDEREKKVLWQLAGTDFGSVYVTADDKERITRIEGFLRPGKEIPFGKLGQVEKAPIQTNEMVVWDVVRPNRALIRVIARGSDRKATTVTVFLVKRPPHEN